MAGRQLPGLGLKGDWALGEDGWKDENDLNLMKLSVLTQGSFSAKVAAEPGAPAEGDIVLLDETHATHPNEIAVYDEAAWNYFLPRDGMLLHNQGAGYYEKFDAAAGAWAKLETGGVAALAALTDVDYTTPPTDGQALIYDDATDKWLPGDVAAGSGGSGGGTKRWYAAGHFTGVDSGSPVIAAGQNIASITKTATGRFRVTFTTPLPHTNFGVNVSGRFTDFADNWTTVAGIDRHIGYGFATTHIDLSFNTSVAAGSTLYDPTFFTLEIYDPTVTMSGGGVGGGEGGVLPYGGARVRLTSSTVLNTLTTWTPIIWTTEERDTDGIWDIANPTRLTVPAGVTKIRLTSRLAGDSADVFGNNQFIFRKNGASFPSGTTAFSLGGGGYTNPNGLGVTDVLDVVEGDYFELAHFIAESGRLDTGSWFAMEIVERSAANVGLNLTLDEVLDVDAAAPVNGDVLRYDAATQSWKPDAAANEVAGINKPFKGAMARLNADKVSSTLPYFVPWDATDYDTDGFWSAAAPTRFTVPAGVSKVRLSGSLAATGLAGNLSLQIYKNGASFRGGAGTGGPTGYTNVIPSLASPALAVAPGDYFELRFNRSTAGSLTYLASTSYFAVEAVEMAA